MWAAEPQQRAGRGGSSSMPLPAEAPAGSAEGQREIHWPRARAGSPRAKEGRSLGSWTGAPPSPDTSEDRAGGWPAPAQADVALAEATEAGQGVQTAGEVKWNLSG